MPECNFRELGTDSDAIPPDLDDRRDPALAVNIGGNIVAEAVEIVEVCQDPDAINIVYLIANVHGVFDYTPELTVIYLDENDIERSVNVSSSLILNYQGSANSVQGVPFSTACGSDSIMFAYDIAHFIPNFVTLYKMTLVLILHGEFDTTSFDFLQDFEDLNVGIFESSDPSDSIVFTKGITAKPYFLYFDPDTGELKLQFFTVGDNQCICSITCADITFDDQELVSCEDEIQEVTISSSSLIGSPTQVDIAIRDSIGNVSDLSYLLVLGTTPLPPGALLYTSPNRIIVTPYLVTDEHTQLDRNKVSYQIWRYTNDPSSSRLVLDWTTKSFSNFADIDVHSGNIYGYSVRFMGEFKEVSNFSSWSTIEI